MKYSSLVSRLSGLGGKWDLHNKVRQMASSGLDVIELTLGEPDVGVPVELQEYAISAIRRGRTKYAAEQGEPGLLGALAEHYSARSGRKITPQNVLCYPGTQTALFATMMVIVEAGDEVIIGDPMYATYEAVVRSTGAKVVPVPLKPEHSFRLKAAEVKKHLTPSTKALLLTTPHNPTGSILSYGEVAQIVELALEHNLWIVCDEVYADLIFDGYSFTSPLEFTEAQDHVVVVSSISKSHAAPGFRSGWCIGSEDFINQSIPLCDTMLFGNQPFIADMTAEALRLGSSVSSGMRERYSARAERLVKALGHGRTPLTVYPPQAGMFALIDVQATGFTGDEFANALLDQAGVAVMPGSSFGNSLKGFIRVTLTADDDAFDKALLKISQFSQGLVSKKIVNTPEYLSAKELSYN